MNNRVGTLMALLALLLTLAACGGGGDEPPHPPTISNLKYSPATALQAPGGTVPISGTFDFADAGGDIISLRITSSGGVDLTVATPALSAIKSGTGTGTFTVSVDTIGRYTFELWAVDSRGSASTGCPERSRSCPTTPPPRGPDSTSCRPPFSTASRGTDASTSRWARAARS